MGRRWEYLYDFGDKDGGMYGLFMEYRPGGTIDIIAAEPSMGVVELVDLPYHALMEGVGVMSGFRRDDDEYEPQGYHVIPDHPWPDHDYWAIAWWNEEHGQWCATSANIPTREEALERLAKRRESAPDMQFRLVRETTIWTAEEG